MSCARLVTATETVLFDWLVQLLSSLPVPCYFREIDVDVLHRTCTQMYPCSMQCLGGSRTEYAPEEASIDVISV
ncbi:hypothetical protein F5148DRAFT_64099 [Russula earlei]|uniref:Uncharacterized protein n=1 Tax=Russula earlei TaxID=71964 RepID=A0ACC0U915_9AGAM|nr:hypothetical protein F5148DRAFT_64099 [Russula earlei]